MSAWTKASFYSPDSLKEKPSNLPRAKIKPNFAKKRARNSVINFEWHPKEPKKIMFTFVDNTAFIS